MKRPYQALFEDHLQKERQMLFFSGPRQVGKTTLGKALAQEAPHLLLNWDNIDQRTLILKGPAAVAESLGTNRLVSQLPRILFDEIHKFKKWKNFIKGFYDTYSDQCKILVTGSSKLGVYKRGGDSLMGRYFNYRIHPLSVAELNASGHPPTRESLDALLKFGGFPEPFLKQSSTFYARWSLLRKEQLFREDIRDLTKVQDIAQMEVLAELLRAQSGQLVSYTNLANKTGVSVDTIRRWCSVLESFYYCFFLRPWTKNVTRSLIKEPKVFLYDWSLVTDPGSRFENLVASHLIKAAQFWTDTGMGEHEVYFLRNKEKQEVDFLMTKEGKPWFLVEAKASDKSLSPSLEHFQSQLSAPHAFQVVQNLDYVAKDCFERKTPIVVPALTLLSQLV